MKSHDSVRSEQRLLEALRVAETAALALRDYAATVLPPPGPPALNELAAKQPPPPLHGWQGAV